MFARQSAMICIRQNAILLLLLAKFSLGIERITNVNFMHASAKQMEPHQQQHQLQRKKRASNHQQYTTAGGSELQAGNIIYGAAGEASSHENWSSNDAGASNNNYLLQNHLRSQVLAQQAYDNTISSQQQQQQQQQQFFNSNSNNLLAPQSMYPYPVYASNNKTQNSPTYASEMFSRGSDRTVHRSLALPEFNNATATIAPSYFVDGYNNPMGVASGFSPSADISQLYQTQQVRPTDQTTYHPEQHSHSQQANLLPSSSRNRVDNKGKSVMRTSRASNTRYSGPSRFSSEHAQRQIYSNQARLPTIMEDRETSTASIGAGTPSPTVSGQHSVSKHQTLEVQPIHQSALSLQQQWNLQQRQQPDFEHSVSVNALNTQLNHQLSYEQQPSRRRSARPPKEFFINGPELYSNPSAKAEQQMELNAWKITAMLEARSRAAALIAATAAVYSQQPSGSGLAPAPSGAYHHTDVSPSPSQHYAQPSGANTAFTQNYTVASPGAPAASPSPSPSSSSGGSGHSRGKSGHRTRATASSNKRARSHSVPR